MIEKAPGYHYSTIKDVVEWEYKMGFKNNLSFTWTKEFNEVRLKNTKKIKKRCLGIAIEPHPVEHNRQCKIMTNNENGFCNYHQHQTKWFKN
jgi:hypothetical protein